MTTTSSPAWPAWNDCVEPGNGHVIHDAPRHQRPWYRLIHHKLPLCSRWQLFTSPRYTALWSTTAPSPVYKFSTPCSSPSWGQLSYHRSTLASHWRRTPALARKARRDFAGSSICGLCNKSCQAVDHPPSRHGGPVAPPFGQARPHIFPG
jgi:hypothetical protein